MTSLAESLVARMAKQRDLMLAMTDECKATSVQITSKDRSVSIEVTGSGVMTKLSLGPSATRLGADELARLIVETARAAAQHALQRQKFLIEEFTKRNGELQNAPLTRWDGEVFQPRSSG